MPIRYIGRLVTVRINSDKKKLIEPFGCIDNKGIEWIVPVDSTTDGKSVPSWLTPIIGDPFEGVTEPAAIVHDEFYKNRARSQADTHRIFRELVLHEMKKKYSLIERMVWQYKRAWLMWAAVVAYGKFKNPDWK